MTTENDMPEMNNGIPPQTQAVSLYGQSDALDDFPVLKAFQQYVDAEQAKAHKRLMTVCAFFSVMMLIVIAVFVFIILGLNRNSSGNDSMIKAMAESNSAIQRQMLEQSTRINEQLMKEMMARANAPQQPVQNPLDAEIQKQNLQLQAQVQALEIERKMAERAAAEAALRPTPTLSDAEKVAKEKELKAKEEEQKAREAKLKDRESKLQEEAKRLKAKEIDLQQRNLYPDAFSPEARQKADEEIKAAKDESQKAKAKAKAAEAKALSAERRATDAQKEALEAKEKAEDAERAAMLEKARLEIKARKLEAELKQLMSERETLQATPVVTKPAEKKSDPLPRKPSKPAVAEDKINPVEQLDGTLRFFDDFEEPQENTKPAGTAAKPKPQAKEQIGKVQSDGTLRFFDDDDYEVPIE